MLSTPKNGWTQFAITDNAGNVLYTADGSYITDLPRDWLEALAFGLEKWVPVTLALDGEGYEMFFVVGRGVSAIMDDRTDNGTMRLVGEFSDWFIRRVAAEIVSDIRRDIDAWANWSLCDTPEQIAWNRDDLLRLCDKIESLIENENMAQ